MKHHPDKGGDAIVFNELNEAYEVLTNKNTKKEYDKKSKFGAKYDEAYELLNYEFDNMAKAWKDDTYDNFIKKDMLHVFVRIDNKEDKEIEYERWITCKKCDGTGKDMSTKIQIKDSSGNVIKMFDSDSGCDFCEGTGLDYLGNKCGFCFGQGKIGAVDCDACKGEKRILVKNKLKNISFEEGQKFIKLEYLGNHSKDVPGKMGHLFLINSLLND
jgi:DnaJ-class molecular chaperone